MFKHTVTYKDFNDKIHTKDLYFHMMAPEFADLEFSTEFDGKLSAYITEAMESGDGQKVYTFFKLMIVNAYGQRSEDGSEFVKNPMFTEKFLNSRAYEEFFMWLVTNPQNAEAFWAGILPERLNEITQAAASSEAKKHPKDMSREELLELMQKTVAEKATTAIAPAV